MNELTENQQAAMEIYAAWKDARGDFESEDPNELAEIASAGINTVIHLGGLVEALQQQLAAAREALSRSKDVYQIVVGSVCAALNRGGITDCDDPGEAIDVMRERLERDIGAWRNRFIDERMNAYPDEGYEMRRCHAESDANEFIDAFHAAMKR